MRTLLAALVLVVSLVPRTFAQKPSTIANDDSCDIALLPAATLLLPYFEVDIDDPSGETTLFTITNVSNLTQVALVTMWTDFGYPILNFNVYLTGYDIQSISLGDVLRYGVIRSREGAGVIRRGRYSDDNPDVDVDDCQALPEEMADLSLNRIRKALTMGSATAIPGRPQWTACDRVGRIHTNAVGYLTIDLVDSCGSYAVPGEPEFLEHLRFDNVLIGDYQQVHQALNFAQVNSMVHIRAIPEGGSYAERVADPTRYANRFPDTFYGRYLGAAARIDDGRQPLPSQFAMRWIDGGPGALQTFLKIWRQPRTTSNYACTDIKANDVIPIAEAVLFDDRENGQGYSEESCGFPICVGPDYDYLPATALVHVKEIRAFPWGTNATSGWVYLNLDDLNTGNGAHQNWVVTSMRAEGRYSGDMDAMQLGNGCSPVGPVTEISSPGTAILGPAPNGN